MTWRAMYGRPYTAGAGLEHPDAFQSALEVMGQGLPLVHFPAQPERF
jgi:hypothetical protein